MLWRLTCLGLLVFSSAALPTVSIASNNQSESEYFYEYRQLAGFEYSKDRVTAGDSELIIVDMQNDFVGEFSYSAAQLALKLSPCQDLLNSSAACFGVKEGTTVAANLVALLSKHQFQGVWVSGDDHHPEHCSFVAAAGGVIAPAQCDKLLRECGPSSTFTGCNGTKHLVDSAAGGAVKGPFPPHCLRGSPGAALHDVLVRGLTEYKTAHPTAALSLVVKGLDVTTDSFGVLPYTQKSWEIYRDAGLFNAQNPVPAALIRSALTWEKHMATGTGAASFTMPFSDEYMSTGPDFSTLGSSMYKKMTVAKAIGSKGSRNIIVSGLAGDWCVLDTAINARALYPDANIYYLVDATRPSFLPHNAAAPYLMDGGASQCSSKAEGCWLLPPHFVNALLVQAGVKVITSENIAS